MTNIQKQIASVTKLHGGEREQVSKYRSFVAWQKAQRAKEDDGDRVGKDFAGNDCYIVETK